MSSGIERHAARIAVAAEQRRLAEAYLRGEYPKWRLSFAARRHVKRLRRARERETGTEQS